MNLIEDCRYDVKGSRCWPLLTVIVLLWLRTIFVVLLAVILHVNERGKWSARWEYSDAMPLAVQNG